LSYAEADIEIPSEPMPTTDSVKTAASRATVYVALIAVSVFKADLSSADDRSLSYSNDMRIMACVTAENIVRARLKDQGEVSFESCASDKFNVDLAADDRDYKVAGYATIVASDGRAAQRHFFVRINHNPGAYSDLGFEVTKVDIDP
jgi:hypothetical protein